MAVYKRDMVDINLETGNIHRSFLKHSIGYKDQQADHFGIRAYRNGEPVNLTGVSIQGIFMPPQGPPIAITSGNIVNYNEAEVVLPQACYNYDGQFTLAIKLVDPSNAVTGTMRIVDGMVDNTNASGTVAPVAAIPSYQEVLSTYEQAIAAINKTVRFDATQSLTDTQKATARSNISAPSVAEMNTAVGNEATARQNADALKVNISDIENDLTGTTAGKVLDARQGKVLDDKITAEAATRAAADSDLKSAIDDVGYMIGGKLITMTKGGYIADTGNLGTVINLTPGASVNYAYAIVDCNAGDTFVINATCGNGGSARPWAFIDSENKLVGYSPSYVSGENAHVTAPTGATKLIINSLIANMGMCIDGRVIIEDVDALKAFDETIENDHTLTTGDLVSQNSNFTITNGTVTATSTERPFNSLFVKASGIKFKYARVGTGNPLYVGVAIGGHFVGNQTRTVVSQINEIYDQTNVAFTGATLNISTGDEDYSATPADYYAEVDQNVFTLKKGSTTIFQFTVSNHYTIDGIAFLNYNFTSLIDCKVVNNAIIDGDNALNKKVNKAEIIGNGANHRMIAGVIRNSGNGWEFIVNAQHQGDMNCVGVGVDNSNRLYIDYSGINAKKVISAIFAPDEDFASRGFFIGASVGLEKAYPEIYQNTLNAVYGTIRYNTSTSVFDISNSDGITSAVWGSDNMLTVTHSQIVSNAMLPCVAINEYGRYIPVIYSYSDTTTKIRFFNANANAGVTTPDGYMKIIFGRFDPVLRRTKVDPSTLVSESGNIWFTGIFEV